MANKAAPDPRKAVPGAGEQVRARILGSSTLGAQLAAALRLPYAFASHFAPEQMMDAVALYREQFRPSERLAAPHVMLRANVRCAGPVAIFLAASSYYGSLQTVSFILARRERIGTAQLDAQ